MREPMLCFVLKPMRIPTKPLFALLLAVLLPMRGFVSAMHCEPSGQDSRAHASHGGIEAALRPDIARDELSWHPAEAPHCADGKGPAHTHACGDCCGGVAAVLTAPRFMVPRAPADLIVGRLARPHPALAIERLDRPPRLLAC
jgi:hypothetical protein